MVDRVAEQYQRFADVEAAGISETYYRWAGAVAKDQPTLTLLRSLPLAKQQPNLIFGAARYLGAPSGPDDDLCPWLLQHWDDVVSVVGRRSTQTNEAARCAVLLPVLSRLEGPLSLIEVGASAGVCLYPDRYSYRYRAGGASVSLDPADGPSPVVFDCDIDEASVPSRLPEVAWRAGIDLEPLDAEDPEDRRWLHALVWPEHEERRRRLATALRTVALNRPRLVRGDLVEQLPAVVSAAPADTQVVVFHSAVLAYLDPAARRRFVDLMESMPEVRWISNESERVLSYPASPPTVPAAGRFVLAVDQRPRALTGPHGQSYEALPLSTATNPVG